MIWRTAALLLVVASTVLVGRLTHDGHRRTGPAVGVEQVPVDTDSDIPSWHDYRRWSAVATPTPTATPQAAGTVSGPVATWSAELEAVVSGYPPEMVQAICGQELPWPCETALWFSWEEMGEKYQPQAVNPVAIDGNHATGLFQIMLPLHIGYFDGDPLDPMVNARAAYGLWRDSKGTFCRHWRYWC